MNVLHGIAASDGIAIGPAFQLSLAPIAAPSVQSKNPKAEWRRFKQALLSVRERLQTLVEAAKARSGEDAAEIFQVHCMMLEDWSLLRSVSAAINHEQKDAATAFHDVLEAHIQAMEAMENPLFRARAADLRDLRDWVLCSLLSLPTPQIGPLPQPVILLAETLLPSQVMLLEGGCVLGIGLADDGPTSHAAILARALSIPMVVGLGPQIHEIAAGSTLILDGGAGTLHLDPDAEALAHYHAGQLRTAACGEERAREPAVTRDGRRVTVLANLIDDGDAGQALACGAEGVGMLRTEFLCTERGVLPDEEAQVQRYRALLELFGEAPVIIRAFDFGGDKPFPGLDLPPEPNPFLGRRGLRLSLAYPDQILRPQLRALLRAAAGRELRLLLPMVTAASEVQAVRERLDVYRAELEAEGLPLPERVEVGALIEVPAAALMADHLAEVVDFFSIGTNDLTQYTMAADRTNAAVAQWTGGLQPAVLRLVEMVVRSAHAAGKWVELCGELAADPAALPLLVELGVDALSVTPAAIPRVKEGIRGMGGCDA